MLISRHTMNRLLLTLLALLTGLAAQISPAAAAAVAAGRGGDIEIGLPQSQLARQAETAARVALPGTAQVQSVAALAQSAPMVRPVLPVRSLLIGIDRARE